MAEAKDSECITTLNCAAYSATQFE